MSVKNLDKLSAAVALLSVLPLLLAGQAMQLACCGLHCRDCEISRTLTPRHTDTTRSFRVADCFHNSPPHTALQEGLCAVCSALQLQWRAGVNAKTSFCSWGRRYRPLKNWNFWPATNGSLIRARAPPQARRS